MARKGSLIRQGRTLTVEYRRLSDVLFADLNPKEHDIPAIIAALRRFKCFDPPAIDERTGKLIAGHGRILAARKMESESQPPPRNVKLDGRYWLVPILRGVHFKNDEDALAYLIADNQTTLSGGWKHEALFAMLSRLGGIDPSILAATGFLDYLPGMEAMSTVPTEGLDFNCRLVAVRVDAEHVEAAKAALEKLALEHPAWRARVD